MKSFLMKTKWIRFLPFLPLLALLVFVNIYGDAGNRFESPAKFVAEAILQRKASYVVSDNFDSMEERYWLIQEMPDELECVTVGQSNVGNINRELVGTESFINLTGNADIYGVMSVFGLMDIYGKHANRIILGPSVHFFNKRVSDGMYDRSKSLKAYADYIIDFLNGKIKDKSNYKNKITSPEFMTTLDKIILVFSLSYFQSNSEFLTLNSTQPAQRYGYLDGKFNYDGGYVRPDGSKVPSKRVLGHDVRYVFRSAADGATLANFAVGEHVTPDRMVLYEKLVKYLIERGTEIEIYLNPYAPAFWDLYDESTRPFLPELEEFCHMLAEKYHFKIIGSYNPYKIGIQNEDFYDSGHIRPDHMSKYFDFKP